jgi:hypothetical protein
MFFIVPAVLSIIPALKKVVYALKIFPFVTEFAFKRDGLKAIFNSYDFIG